jgi:hypothetical protein
MNPPSSGECHPQTPFFKANKKLQGDENTMEEKTVKCPIAKVKESTKTG